MRLALVHAVAIRQIITIRTLPIRTQWDVTGSVFPRVDEFLSDDKNLQGLMWVAGRKSAKDYRSLIDWLYCETFTHMRTLCNMYYEGTGYPLVDIIKEELRAHEEDYLMCVLRRARALYDARQRRSWKWLMESMS